MKNVIKSVKVWFRYKDNKDTQRYVIGTYHPNVDSIYLSEYQYWDILKKYGAREGEVRPYGNCGKVKVMWKDGHNSIWE